MRIRVRSAPWAVLGSALVLGSGAATAAQVDPLCDQQSRAPVPEKAQAPEKVQAKVVRIDATTGLVTVQDQNGRTYEFYGSPGTLRDVRVGETLKGRFGQSPTC